MKKLLGRWLMTVSVADKIIEFLALLRFNLIHELADLVLQALVQYGLKRFRETVENAPTFRIPNVHPSIQGALQIGIVLLLGHGVPSVRTVGTHRFADWDVVLNLKDLRRWRAADSLKRNAVFTDFPNSKQRVEKMKVAVWGNNFHQLSNIGILES